LVKLQTQIKIPDPSQNKTTSKPNKGHAFFEKFFQKSCQIVNKKHCTLQNLIF